MNKLSCDDTTSVQPATSPERAYASTIRNDAASLSTVDASFGAWCLERRQRPEVSLLLREMAGRYRPLGEWRFRDTVIRSPVFHSASSPYRQLDWGTGIRRFLASIPTEGLTLSDLPPAWAESSSGTRSHSTDTWDWFRRSLFRAWGTAPKSPATMSVGSDPVSLLQSLPDLRGLTSADHDARRRLARDNAARAAVTLVMQQLNKQIDEGLPVKSVHLRSISDPEFASEDELTFDVHVSLESKEANEAWDLLLERLQSATSDVDGQAIHPLDYVTIRFIWRF